MSQGIVAAIPIQGDLFAATEEPVLVSHPAVGSDYLAEVLRDWAPARPTAVFATYWRFAAARQAIYIDRIQGGIAPWTDDWILAGHRFTNAYRAADRVSQYLIQQVQYPIGEMLSPHDIVFRTLVFKIFNRIETWELLVNLLGPITWARYTFEQYDAILTEALQRGDRIFSAAYIMPAGSAAYRDVRKHRSFLRLIETMMADNLPGRVEAAGSLAKLYEILRSYPMMGNFLAFQYAVDLNYSPLTNYEENSFVVAGPGACDGLSKCFADTGGVSSADLIARIADQQEVEFARLGLQFSTLWGRSLQPVDCQNLFCEVAKYARIAHPEATGMSGRTRIKQRYLAAGAEPLSAPWFPPGWGLNADILAGKLPGDLDA